MCSGLGRVCATAMYISIGHMEFPKFQTGIFVEWKAPLNLNPSCLHKMSYFGDYITCVYWKIMVVVQYFSCWF